MTAQLTQASAVAQKTFDLTNPAKPREMAHFGNVGTIHGLWTSDDGNRAYLCETSPTDGVEIIDTTQVQGHRANPQDPIISTAPLPDNAVCQSTYPVSYGKHWYVIQYGEQPNAHCPSSTITSYSTPTNVNTSTGSPTSSSTALQ